MISINKKLKSIVDTQNTLIELMEIVKHDIENPKDTLEDYVLNKIKQHEGLRLKRYKDAAGHWTIGYGHKIKDHENYKEITVQKAEQLLREDFNNAKLAAIRLSPNLEIYPYRLYAIAHFVFAKGSGNYAASGLRQAVNENRPIEEEMTKWDKITTNGKTSSKYLHEINLWRIELYNKY